MYDDDYYYPPYVPVAQRRAEARKKMQRLRQQGMNIQPIENIGRKISQTFWGEAWCRHLEQYSDYSNRLPRGRTYVRNGSVCHLSIKKGRIKAIVSGSSLYNIEVKITPLTASRWKAIKKQCAGQIGSLLELLQGKLSKQVMQIVTHPKNGLFPSPREIKLECDCPDWAIMCKHVAAILYGIAARLDQHPELLFVLRGVDHNDLISAEVQIPESKSAGKGKRRQLKGDLSTVFGIELDESTQPAKTSRPIATPKKKSSTTEKSKTSRAKVVKATQTSEAKQKILRPTGKSVARLRKRFAMTQTQFARLVGVSAKTVASWENQSKRLTLRPESFDALARVNKLDKVQAWKHR